MSLFGINELTVAVQGLTATVKADGLARKTEVAALSAAMRDQAEAIRALTGLLRGAPNPIGKLEAQLVGEVDNMAMQFNFPLPTFDPTHPLAGTIKEGRVTLTYDGVVQPDRITAKGQEKLLDVRVKAGVMLGGSFAFVDQSNNFSSNPVQMTEFLVEDKVPPPDPVGGFGAELVGEVPDEDPAVGGPEPTDPIPLVANAASAKAAKK